MLLSLAFTVCSFPKACFMLVDRTRAFAVIVYPCPLTFNRLSVTLIFEKSYLPEPADKIYKSSPTRTDNVFLNLCAFWMWTSAN